MAARKASDEQLLEALTTTRSPVKLARMFDMSERAVIGRIRKLGVPPLTHADRGKPVVYLPENRVRVTMDMPDGIIVVGSDAHFRPDHRATAFRAFLEVIKRIKPEGVILNGDILDGQRISRHGRRGWEPQMTVKQELEAVQDRMAEIREVAGNAVLHRTIGNHDQRLEVYLATNAGPFEGVQGFTLCDHIIGWHESVSIMINGHTQIKHRHRGGKFAAPNNVADSHINFVTGHTHSLNWWKVATMSPVNGGVVYGIDNGTLADPWDESLFGYCEDGPRNWSGGFTVLTFRNGNLMPPDQCQVIDTEAGLCWFRGESFTV